MYRSSLRLTRGRVTSHGLFCLRRLCGSARSRTMTGDIFSAPTWLTKPYKGLEPMGIDVSLFIQQPTQVAGPMSYSDLEHFPFDDGDDSEGTTRPSGASRAPSPNDSAPPSSRDAKIFRDGNGVTWWVHEVSGEYLGTVGAMCLLIVSASELRRVWKYPPDWRTLTVGELLRLPFQAPRAEDAR